MDCVLSNLVGLLVLVTSKMQWLMKIQCINRQQVRFLPTVRVYKSLVEINRLHTLTIVRDNHRWFKFLLCICALKNSRFSKINVIKLTLYGVPKTKRGEKSVPWDFQLIAIDVKSRFHCITILCKIISKVLLCRFCLTCRELIMNSEILSL